MGILCMRSIDQRDMVSDPLKERVCALKSFQGLGNEALVYLYPEQLLTVLFPPVSEYLIRTSMRC